MTRQPADSPSTAMTTPWGDAVTADNAWREYPRPQLVRDAWTNLNGTWQYAIAPRHLPAPTQWDGDILVPFCVESTLSGVARHVGSDERLWYRRSVHIADTSQRWLLHFGAVDHRAALWLNGAWVGAHEGGFDAFSFDVTEFLREGSNELVLAVDDATSDGEQPRGKQHRRPSGIWYTPVTGIWQTVWLEPLPRANHIAEVRTYPSLQTTDGETTCTVEVEVLLARPTRDATLAAEVTLRLDGNGVASTLARPDRRVRLHVDAPMLWSPAQPALYDVEVALVRVEDPWAAEQARADAAGEAFRPRLRGAEEAARFAAARRTDAAPIDVVRSYLGLRTIAVGPHPSTGTPTLLLNGAPLFQLGTLDQGWWPDGLHTPPSDAAMAWELAHLKSAGFNTVRKHIKVEPARWYWHCDRLGLLVWQDMPSGFLPAQFVAPDDEGEALRTSAGTEAFEAALARMLHALRGHPSVVSWVLHNEGWGQFESARLTAFIQGKDGTRPVNACSGWLDMGAGDINDRHDYAPDPQAPAHDGRRASVIGEYGGIGWPIEGHLWNPGMRNWGYQTFHDETTACAAYARATTAILQAQREHGVCAAIYTQTSDVEGEVNGLLTYDRRRVKFTADWLAQVHAPLFTGGQFAGTQFTGTQ